MVYPWNPCWTHCIHSMCHHCYNKMIVWFWTLRPAYHGGPEFPWRKMHYDSSSFILSTNVCGISLLSRTYRHPKQPLCAYKDLYICVHYHKSKSRNPLHLWWFPNTIKCGSCHISTRVAIGFVLCHKTSSNCQPRLITIVDNTNIRSAIECLHT